MSYQKGKNQALEVHVGNSNLKTFNSHTRKLLLKKNTNKRILSVIFMKVLANPCTQKPWDGILKELPRMKTLKHAFLVHVQ